MHRLFSTILGLAAGLMASAALSYTNPILYADYSDPDVIRIDKDYYMTASSFNCSPGLPILYSGDMVHWQIVTHALPHGIPGGTEANTVEHGNQVWAPSIRQHNDTVYIVWGDPDKGIYQVHSRITKNLDPHLLNPAHWDFGEWSEPYLLIPGKGLIDATPLWDDKGKTYIVHALAGSRAELKSVLCIAEVDAQLTRVKTPSRIVWDGHKEHPTCEGPKLYKKGGYYYIFCPAGGVSTGWQLAMRSKNIYGPYEVKTVLTQGNTTVNGPHQGAWVTGTDGKDWFFHFQDVGPLGRILHLQPMRWVDNWPVIGKEGEPIINFPQDINPKAQVKPAAPSTKVYNAEDGSDDFSNVELGKQWQWQACPQERWYFCDADAKLLRLYSVAEQHTDGTRGDATNLWNVRNILMQKPTAPTQTITAKVGLHPTNKYVGERGGLVMLGMDYAALVLVNTADGIQLQYVVNKKADKNGKERVEATVNDVKEELWLRVRYETQAGEEHAVKAQFSYSADGTNFTNLGSLFDVKEGKWIGAKWGLFCTRPNIKSNDGGHLDVLSVQVTNE